jgi:hypothetical protein
MNEQGNIISNGKGNVCNAGEQDHVLTLQLRLDEEI